MNTSSMISFMNKTVTDLKANYEKLGLKASGKYGKALEYKIVESDNMTRYQIWGAAHSQYMTNGRGANTDKSVDSAKKLYPIALKWLEEKGISVDNQKQFAFRIALKWVYKGIQVPNTYNPGTVIEDVINQQWFRDGIKTAGGALIPEFKSEVLKSLKLI